MQEFEKLGVFYLGKVYNPTKRKVEEEPLLYDSKNLTTHAICLGMTGSGKTGLGIDILEEAAIDKIPSLIIDPKGDLGNLLLTFPNLSPKEFKPWIDPAEAERHGMDPSAYADEVAKIWKEGLADWGQGPERIQKLLNSVEMHIYTPASKAGIPISILSSFAAPPKELLLDPGALREKILSLTSSLLGLLGLDADPIKSREHILVSTLIDQAWRKGLDLNLVTLIQQVQQPPFDKIGVLDIDTFYPPKDRMALSVSLNNLLASPGFQAWMEGEPLDIQKLLYTSEGKPKLSILSIAHLSDPERMFFVTIFLNQLLTWMRQQPGTSSLRALLYMDEIFGYFPPTAMPPSKLPMLTLLKQARAYGLGVVLATQNPVDLDYKGLANCGTWFIGKLQTERDRARVLEGLNVASNGELDSKMLSKMIASTGKRVFIMRSIYEKDPILFQTRWSLSYLRGPLTLVQIATLTQKTPQPIIEESEAEIKTQGTLAKPAVPPNVPEFFINPATPSPCYHAQVGGFAKLHYVDAKNKIDTWDELCLVAPTDEKGKTVLWEEGSKLQNPLSKDPLPASTFTEISAGLMQEKNYAAFSKSLASALYQNHSLSIYRSHDLGIMSKPGENEADFRIRISQTYREKRDELINRLRIKYGEKINQLNDRLRRAQEKLNQQQQQAGMQKAETYISFGATILGAILGKGVTKGTISQAGTSMRRMGKISKENQDVTLAEQNYNALQQELQDVQMQLNNEIAQLAYVDPSSLKIETLTLKPRKSDISIEKIALIWTAE